MWTKKKLKIIRKKKNIRSIEVININNRRKIIKIKKHRKNVDMNNWKNNFCDYNILIQKKKIFFFPSQTHKHITEPWKNLIEWNISVVSGKKILLKIEEDRKKKYLKYKHTQKKT